MGNNEQLQALQELLEHVIHSLDLTQYEIEDPTIAYQTGQLADSYFQEMIQILNHNRSN